MPRQGGPTEPGVDRPESVAAAGRQEVMLFALGCLAFAAAVMVVRPFDRLLDWSSLFDRFNLDGVVALLLAAPVATGLYARRRIAEVDAARSAVAESAVTDPLTGLPNAAVLDEWLARDLARERETLESLALLVVAVDRLAEVADTYGYRAGEELLRAVVERIRAKLRQDDHVYRTGEATFVIVSPSVQSRGSVERVAERLIADLEVPVTIGSDSIRVSANIGITMVENFGLGADAVERQVDVAVEQAKRAGRGRTVIYDEHLHGNVLSPLVAESRLQGALTNGEFALYFQPVIDVQSGTLFGLEALLRWFDPEFGAVPPNDFVPILEDSGLIVPVGAWVLEEACRQARRWREAHPERAPLKVTVNISARQLAQVDFHDLLRDVISGTGVDRNQICLEITEEGCAPDMETAWAALRQAKALGVHLALDDFGTGHSSLSYVRQFELDMLKIDRSFVQGLGQYDADTAIVENVIRMARSLGILTVAEGVERPDQFRELQRLGCDYAQGYFFSHAVPVSEVDEMLAGGEELHRWAQWAVPAPAPERTAF